MLVIVLTETVVGLSLTRHCPDTKIVSKHEITKHFFFRRTDSGSTFTVSIFVLVLGSPERSSL